MKLQFNSLGDWVNWTKGDRFPYWTEQWRLVNSDGTVVHEGTFDSCFYYVQEQLEKTDSSNMVETPN